MDKKRLLLRIDPRLWEDLQRWASDELRSINGQIEYLLKQAVEERRRPRTRGSPPRAVQSENEG